jgi:hypothetical protein
MTIVLAFVIFYIIATIWDVVHVNGLVGKMIDPGAYRRAHPGVPAEPAPRLIIPGQTLPDANDR